MLYLYVSNLNALLLLPFFIDHCFHIQNLPPANLIVEVSLSHGNHRLPLLLNQFFILLVRTLVCVKKKLPNLLIPPPQLLYVIGLHTYSSMEILFLNLSLTLVVLRKCDP